MVTRGVGTAPSVPSVIALILEEGRVLRYVTTPGLRGMDIVHIHSSSYWSFFRSAQYLLQSRLLSGGRIMLHIHSGEFGEFFTRLPTPIRGWGRWVIERADIIIVTSPVGCRPSGGYRAPCPWRRYPTASTPRSSVRWTEGGEKGAGRSCRQENAGERRATRSCEGLLTPPGCA